MAKPRMETFTVEVFGSDPANLVSTIVFNGIVEALELSAGHSTACLRL